MSTEDAKAYLSNREVPRLFECLMTGLMFHRPIDHIQYLIDSLEKVKTKGQSEMTWNMFVEVRSAKTPLPPITPDNGKRPVSRGRVTPKEDFRPRTPAKTTPLPPIGSSGLPNVPVIFIMGGPGSGKSVQANKLVEKHPGWVNINLGELLRSEIGNKGAEEKWKMVKDLVVCGELAPEEITIELLESCFKSNTEANGFVIQGFPRDMEQAQLFQEKISRVDAMFLLDCEEEQLTSTVLARGQKSGRVDDSPSALARRMATFKEKTLPVLKHYDDLGKLFIVDGHQDEEVIHDELSIIFETLLQSTENGRIPSPPTEGRPSSSRRSKRSTTAPPLSPAPAAEPDVTVTMPTLVFIPPPEIKVKDEGRKSELPQAPIIFLAGGPGSGKGTQCAKIMARYPDIIHLSMGDILRKEISEKGSADEKWGMITKLLKQGDMAPTDVTEELLIRSMNEFPDAKAYLVEGYPRDALQYEDFNRNIGGHSFTILLDCEEQYLQDRLVLRGAGGNERIDDNLPAIENKVAFFARNTMPLLKAIEDEEKLILVDGDRDEDEIFYDIVKCLDFSLYGIKLDEGKSGQEGAEGQDVEDGGGEGSGDGQVPVVEETMVAETAVPTGEDVANPEYSAELDSLPAPAEELQTEQGEATQCEEAVERREAVDQAGGAETEPEVAEEQKMAEEEQEEGKEGQEAERDEQEEEEEIETQERKTEIEVQLFGGINPESEPVELEIESTSQEIEAVPTSDGALDSSQTLEIQESQEIENITGQADEDEIGQTANVASENPSVGDEHGQERVELETEREKTDGVDSEQMTAVQNGDVLVETSSHNASEPVEENESTATAGEGEATQDKVEDNGEITTTEETPATTGETTGDASVTEGTAGSDEPSGQEVEAQEKTEANSEETNEEKKEENGE